MWQRRTAAAAAAAAITAALRRAAPPPEILYHGDATLEGEDVCQDLLQHLYQSINMFIVAYSWVPGLEHPIVTIANHHVFKDEMGFC